MSFSIQTFQQNGFDIIALKNDGNATQVEIIPSIGAMLHAFRVMHQGRLLNIIDNYNSKEEYQQQFSTTFKGVKLSPYACRIPGGQYQWRQTSYHITKSLLPGQALHGLLYDAPFAVIEQEATAEEAMILLEFDYRSEDPGYPFSYNCRVRYRLLEGHELEIHTTLASHMPQPIPVMDGWHPYFSTGTPVDELYLRFNADRLVEFNEQLVPTGRLLPLEDYLQPQPLKGISLDNSFLLNPALPGPACTLHDPKKGISIDLYPDQHYPVLQIYIPPQRNSIAIEHLSGAPNAFNNGMGLYQLERETPLTFGTRIGVRLA
jgi:aldose 1-epimerase